MQRTVIPDLPLLAKASYCEQFKAFEIDRDNKVLLFLIYMLVIKTPLHLNPTLLLMYF